MNVFDVFMLHNSTTIYAFELQLQKGAKRLSLYVTKEWSIYIYLIKKIIFKGVFDHLGLPLHVLFMRISSFCSSKLYWFIKATYFIYSSQF